MAAGARRGQETYAERLRAPPLLKLRERGSGGEGLNGYAGLTGSNGHSGRRTWW